MQLDTDKLALLDKPGLDGLRDPTPVHGDDLAVDYQLERNHVMDGNVDIDGVPVGDYLTILRVKYGRHIINRKCINRFDVTGGLNAALSGNCIHERQSVAVLNHIERNHECQPYCGI